MSIILSKRFSIYFRYNFELERNNSRCFTVLHIIYSIFILKESVFEITFHLVGLCTVQFCPGLDQRISKDISFVQRAWTLHRRYWLTRTFKYFLYRKGVFKTYVMLCSHYHDTRNRGVIMMKDLIRSWGQSWQSCWS